MEKTSGDLWKERLKNQQHQLIGSTVPHDGNGYTDQLSFELSHHRLVHPADKYRGYWLYIVYFRDLGAYLNPSYGKNKEMLRNGIKFENCSDNYRKTFIKYLNKYEDWRTLDILNELGDWTDRLVRDGRVIFEFVSWLDNDSGVFYAYELKLLDNDRCKVDDHFVHFSGPEEMPDGELKEHTVKIPREKCIVLEWPKERGGYAGYKKKVQQVLGLGDIHDNFAAMLEQPGQIMAKTKTWEIAFEAALHEWGTAKPNENTTSFYKQSNYFTYKGTLIYCLRSCINGFEQIFAILNKKLEEQARVEFQAPLYDDQKLKELEEKWLAGQLSFKEGNAFLIF